MKLLSILLCSFLVSGIYAQDSVRPNVLDIDFQGGIMTTRWTVFTPADWNRLTPGYLNKDETDTTFLLDKSEGSSETSYMQLQVLRGFDWNKFNSRNISTQFGFFAAGESGIYADRLVDNRTTYRVDTLTGTSGFPIYRDSISWKQEKKVLESKFIDFGLSVMFQTNRSRRFSFLTGVTIHGGLQYRGQVYISKTETTTFEHSALDAGVPNPMFEGSTTQFEPIYFSSPWAFQVGARVPLELDYKLGKYFEFLEGWTYNLSVVLGYRYTQIQGIGTQDLFSTAFIGGLKYRLRD